MDVRTGHEDVPTRARLKPRPGPVPMFPCACADRTAEGGCGRTLWETPAEWEHERELDIQADADMSAGHDGLEPAQRKHHPLAETQAVALTVGMSEERDDALPKEAQQRQEPAVQQCADGAWSDSVAEEEYVSPLAMSVAHYTDAWAHDDVHVDHGGCASSSKMEVRA